MDAYRARVGLLIVAVLALVFGRRDTYRYAGSGYDGTTYDDGIDSSWFGSWGGNDSWFSSDGSSGDFDSSGGDFGGDCGGGDGD